MTSKEKLKDIINQSFDKQKNYDIIIANTKRKFEFGKYIKYSIISICLLMIGIIGLTKTNPKPNKILSSSNNNYDVTNYKININKIDKPNVVTYAEFALMTNDFDEKNIQELEEYFGTKIIPKNVDNFALSSKSRFGYYRGNNDGNEKIYYDQNTIIYEDTLNNKKLEIIVSKTRKPHFDFDFRKEDSSLYEMSIINNFELPIFNFSYKVEDAVNCYYTTFEKDNVYFDITGYNLNINNFVTIIASIVDDASK